MLARLEAFVQCDLEVEWLAGLYANRDSDDSPHFWQDGAVYALASRGGDEVYSALADWMAGALSPRTLAKAEAMRSALRRVLVVDVVERRADSAEFSHAATNSFGEFPDVQTKFVNGLGLTSWSPGLRLRLVPPARPVSPEVRDRLFSLIHRPAKGAR